ncbi:MAG: nitroreductase family protein [Bacteroidales bacterium]|nr:nitroreductase family protein [Bacteroidales bacterium]
MYSKIRHYLGKRYNAFRWLSHEFFLLLRHLGTSDREHSQTKLRADLIVEAHIIEKGLSFRHTKVGFGVPKIIDLLDHLTIYHHQYKDQYMLSFILRIVEKYIEFNAKHGVVNEAISNRYHKLKEFENNEYPEIIGGVNHITREEIQKSAMIDFENFVNSRYSIRNFTGEAVDPELVFKALKIAEGTPSACNRQPWGAHVFFDKQKMINILDYQTGARQFKEEMGCVILVTSSYNSFFGGEFHQPYVNGGLYAMTLMYALHSFGLGTVSLNMGFEYSKLKKLSQYCDIQESEVPIMMIGVGVLPEELDVAHSERFSYKSYTKVY